MNSTASRVSNAAFLLAMVLYFAGMSGYFGLLIWRTRRWKVAATAIAFTGWTAQLVSVVARTVAAGHAPWGNMYEFTLTLSFVLVGAFLFVGQARLGIPQAGGFVLGAAALLMGLGWVLYAEPGELQPALRSWWLTFHVMLVMAGAALLILGAALSLMYVAKARWESKFGMSPEAAADAGPEDLLVPGHILEGADHDAALPADGDYESVAATEAAPDEALSARPVRQGLIARLPASEKLDRAAYKIIAFAFPIWTLGVIAGAVWGEQAWGRWWGWDPKETLSFVVWVIFAVYLHARVTRGWRGRSAAIIAAVGGAAVLFNFYAVNLWIAGLHSYAGVS